ncbi:MAG TPA: hypothetical protein VLG47_07235 [Candidatus Saccharimonadales bacterium]|nr:hypothetical protein [Candidatus Saccharimonadales bacterium]
MGHEVQKADVEIDPRAVGEKSYGDLSDDERLLIAIGTPDVLHQIASAAFRHANIPTLAAINMAALTRLEAARTYQGALTESEMGYHAVADFTFSRIEQLNLRENIG